LGARVERTAFELAHVAGEPEHAMRIRAGEIGLQHGAADGRGIGIVEPAGGERIDEERTQSRGGDAPDGFGLGQHVVAQPFATAISSGNLSTTSCPSLVTMKVWPRKMPNSPSAVIGLGSAMMIMPGLSTLSISSASVRSVKTCGLSVTMSMPCTWVGRDCTPLSRKNFGARRMLSVALPVLTSATFFL